MGKICCGSNGYVSNNHNHSIGGNTKKNRDSCGSNNSSDMMVAVLVLGWAGGSKNSRVVACGSRESGIKY